MAAGYGMHFTEAEAREIVERLARGQPVGGSVPNALCRWLGSSSHLKNLGGLPSENLTS